MKNNALTFISVLFTSFTFSQALPPVSVCVGVDATVCLGQTVTINDCGNLGGASAGGSGAPYTISTIPYTPDPYTAGTQVTLSDDSQTGLLNIGFNFCYYGNTYSQFIIGANNFITFSAGGSATWVTTPIPNPGTVPKNAIMGPWQDINPGVGGTVRYQVYGVAPFRRLVVSWNNIPMFSCTGQLYTSQIVIYETTNIIETFIQNKSICSTWNSGNAVHGLHNINGTSAVTVTGRNNTQWTATNEGLRFNPGALGVEWASTTGATFPYNNGVLNLTIIPPGTTGYFLRSTCGGVGSISDTTFITRVSASVTATATPDICSSGIGTVTANPGNGTAPFQFSWPTLAASTQTVNNVNGGTYSVFMLDANNCPATATVTVGNTPANYTNSSTVVTCPGAADGTATASMVPPLGNLTYLWNDPAGQTTETATGLTAGNYTCVITSDIGCVGTINVTVGQIPGMIATLANKVDVTCNSSNDGILAYTITQGTPTYTYSWDNSTSAAASATDLYAGIHTLTITDANNCVITITDTIGEPDSLSIAFLTPPTQICPEDQITLSVTGLGGSSPYTFIWSENGNVIGTGTSISVDPLNTNTAYCVEITEACGSPTTDSCTVIFFPTAIQPILTPNKLEDCTPSVFEFYNNSVNGSEIATTFITFSDGNSYLLNGTDSVSNLFIQPTFYSAGMTVTSIYGCVYTDTFTNLINVKPLPTPDFTFSSNPATFFETNIQLQDRSSADVIAWEWISPNSSPALSYLKNPVFTFPEGIVGSYPITLIVTTPNGCSDSITYTMQIVEDVLFYAPNSFTPDGDEYNQAWGVSIGGLDIYRFDLYIFNRWGEMIWESHNPAEKWDGTYKGKLVPTGTYVWRASAKSAINDGKYEFNGYINVLK